MKDLFYLFIAFFLFFLFFYVLYFYFLDRRNIQKMMRSGRKAMNRRKKKFKLL